jgi:jumonji domain-containing protein 7
VRLITSHLSFGGRQYWRSFPRPRKMPLQDPLATLITTYHELNATAIDEFHEEPSALEFMRYVAKNRPFVVRGGAKSWEAFEKWNAAYLADVMKDAEVQVAVTPYG